MDDTWSKIGQLDLTLEVAAAKSNNQWDDARAAQAEREYREFLWICAHFHDRPDRLGMLPKDADEVWHMHLLHTRKYREDCTRALGFFVDHEPVPPGQDAGAAEKAEVERVWQGRFNHPLRIYSGCRHR